MSAREGDGTRLRSHPVGCRRRVKEETGMKFGLMAPYKQGPVEDGAYVQRLAQITEELDFE